MIIIKDYFNENNSGVAEIIKNKRKELGLSLKNLENLSGISASYIHRIENNSRNNPSYETIKKLYLALNIDTSELPGVAKNPITILEDNNVIQMLKREEISYNGSILSFTQKSKLGILIDHILNCNWNDESKIDDIKMILDLVNSLKNK